MKRIAEPAEVAAAISPPPLEVRDRHEPGRRRRGRPNLRRPSMTRKPKIAFWKLGFEQLMRALRGR